MHLNKRERNGKPLLRKPSIQLVADFISCHFGLSCLNACHRSVFRWQFGFVKYSDSESPNKIFFKTQRINEKRQQRSQNFMTKSNIIDSTSKIQYKMKLKEIEMYVFQCSFIAFLYLTHFILANYQQYTIMEPNSVLFLST